MGNCCGKASSNDEANFQGQGRTLGGSGGTAPTASNTVTRASIPSNKQPLNSAPKTNPSESRSSAAGGPREAAARAAEERANATAAQNKGKLGRQLDSQRAQTQSETLAQTARDNVALRDADAAAQARNYN